MLRLIIGKNASGKTVYLNRQIKSRSKTDINSNIGNQIYKESIGYDERRIEILKDCLETNDITEDKKFLGISNSSAYSMSKELASLFTLMCKEGKYLILDEPFKSISYYEHETLLKFISYVQKTYEEIYIVTHNELALSIPGATYYTVDFHKDADEINLTAVNDENALAVID